MKKTLLILGLIISIIFNIDAQIESIKYLIEYNDITHLYDCKIVIIEGKAQTYPQRIQFNSQYTIVVPHGTTLKIEELYNPKEANQFYEGTIPCLWEFGPKEIAPPITPLLDYHTVFPNLSPPCAFYNLWTGKTITLFSVSADIDPCDNAVRPFDNVTGPSSLDMPSGGDFSNGYSFGGGVQVYGGNISTDYTINYISPNDSLSICNGECIILKPTIVCLGDALNYQWSTGETTEEIEICPESPTHYYVLVKDTLDNLLDSLPIFVGFDKVVINGPSTICSGEITILTPNFGGSWSQSYSSNPNVTTIDNFGIVIGIYEGKVVYKYTDYSGLCEPIYSDTIYVLGAPETSFIGNDRICIGSTSSVSPSSGGTWESFYPEIASIDSITGEIIGLAQGFTKFTFTDDITGCESYSLTLVVYDLPNFYIEVDSICIGSTTVLQPASGGVWSSLNPEIATVDGNIVTGESYGDATLIFTDSATGCVSEPAYINIGTSLSTVFSGPDRICIGDVTTIEPSSGGNWSSNDEAIATIDNQGNITGIAPGEVTFMYVSEDSLCIISPSAPVLVKETPFVSLGATDLCLSETMNLSPYGGGTWIGDNPTIASVGYHTGKVTGLAEGTATFTFTSGSTGCPATTEQVTILPSPFELYYPIEVCPGETASLIDNYIGTWISDNPNVATVDPLTGVITGVLEGSTIITFTDANTNCSSEVEVEVHEIPTLNYVGSDELCVGEGSTLSPIGGGTWVSNDPSIASITSSGQVIALSPGQTSFTFTTYNGGCSLNSDDMVVLPASDPSCIISTTDDLESQTIKLYPNPAKDIINVEGISPIESISIYTMGYKKIKNLTFEDKMNNRQISIEDLMSGLYIIEFRSKGNISYKKLIVN